MDYREVFKNEGLFLEVASLYYDKNFGTISKSETDLFMFKILYRKMQDKTGKKPSEFELAKMLGISKQKIRNMIEKMELKYPIAVNTTWQNEVAKLFGTNAFQCGGSDEEFLLFIDDVVLRYEIENFLASNYLPTEYTLNSHVITLRKPAVLALVYECCQPGERNDFLKVLAKDTNKTTESIKDEIVKGTFWYRASKNLGREVWSFVSNIIASVVASAIMQRI